MCRSCNMSPLSIALPFPFSSEDKESQKTAFSALPKETPMPEVGKEKSYWLKEDVFAKAKSKTEDEQDAATGSSSGFSFGFGKSSSSGTGFSLLQKHGKVNDKDYA